MPNYIRHLYDKTEQLKGKKLVAVLSIAVILSLGLGILLGNFTPLVLNKDEALNMSPEQTESIDQSSKYEGMVRYVDPQLHPVDKISYSLNNFSGEEIVLLKAQDQTLEVVEGLSVIVFGTLEKTADGKKDVLLVDKVLIKNK